MSNPLSRGPSSAVRRFDVSLRCCRDQPAAPGLSRANRSRETPGRCQRHRRHRDLGWSPSDPMLGRDGAGPVGERVKTSDLGARILPALLSGTSRQPLQLESTAHAGAGPLAALSVAAQFLRLEWPLAPEEFAFEAPIFDERCIVPESVRKPMIRLLSSRRLTDDVELALAWNFSRLGLRPHPFDLHGLLASPRLTRKNLARLPRRGYNAKAPARQRRPTVSSSGQKHSTRPTGPQFLPLSEPPSSFSSTAKSRRSPCLDSIRVAERNRRHAGDAATGSGDSSHLSGQTLPGRTPD